MFHQKIQRLIVILSLSLMSALCVADNEISDPFEGFNRSMFAFNERVDRNLLRPLAVVYNAVTPTVVDKAVTDAFGNAQEPIVIVNDLAQFKFTQAARDTARFLINTTVGFFGLFDVASAIGLPRNNEDFGQTLGYWGVGTGPYLVLPLLGPKTFRALAGDTASIMSDLGATGYVEGVENKLSLIGVELVDIRSDLMLGESMISGDRYAFVRSAYFQRREFLVNDGVIENEFGDDFDLFEDEDF